MSCKELIESGVSIPEMQPYLTDSVSVTAIPRFPSMIHGDLAKKYDIVKNITHINNNFVFNRKPSSFSQRREPS